MIQRAVQTEPHSRIWSREEFDRMRAAGLFSGEHVDLIAGEVVSLGDPARGPQPRPWTKKESYLLNDLGFFLGQKAELLGGEIMVASPQNWPHYSTLDRVAEVLEGSIGLAVWIRTQAPLDLGLTTEPESDVSVVPGRRQDYTAHPTTALLVVEVSDTTLAYDRGEKASHYAAGGIRDYWVVDLVHERLEVRRNPVVDPSQVHGYGYADVIVLSRGDQVTPLAFPGVSIAVADLLP